jgi:predicted nucleic acid-binding protein
VKAALDTNLLVYTEQRSEKGDRARALALSFPERKLVLPAQVCGELFNVLTRKAAFQAADAAQTVRRWRLMCEVADTTDAVLDAALDLAVQHHLAIWDAMILSSACDKRCDLLLSEDLHPGFRWRGVTVVNPFAEPMSPLLDAFLDQGRG